MNATELLRRNLETSDRIFRQFLDGLTDAELLVRSSPAANHTAWQIGHLISAEHGLTNSLKPGIMPPMPEGFSEKYAKGTDKNDTPSDFLSKEKYFAIWSEQRKATLAYLATLSESDLGQPAPESIRSWCPTVADLFLILGNHPMMHAGQVTAVRRKLGKPTVM